MINLENQDETPNDDEVCCLILTIFEFWTHMHVQTQNESKENEDPGSAYTGICTDIFVNLDQILI